MKLIQVSDRTHKALKLLAAREGMSMKDLVEKLLRKVVLK